MHNKQGITCSSKCAWVLKKESYLKSCGSEHNFSRNSKSRIEFEKEMFEKEGITNVYQRPIVIEKIKETFRERYGVTNCSQLDEVKNKKKETFLKNYGTLNMFEVLEIFQKFKKTCLAKYGTNFPNQSEIVKSKIKKTCLEKYGVEYYLATDECKERSIKHFQEKYGVNFYSQSEDFKRKMTDLYESEDFRNKLIERGLMLDPNILDEKNVYYYNVHQFTKSNLKKYGKMYLGEGWEDQIGKNKYHIDHIVSISYGFKNKIDPKIIGSIHNLRLLLYVENCKKKDKNGMPLEILLEKIKNSQHDNQ